MGQSYYIAARSIRRQYYDYDDDGDLMMMMVVVGSAQKPGQSIILQLLLCPMLLFTQGGFGYTVYLE